MSLMLSCTSALTEEDIPPPDDEIVFTLVAEFLIGPPNNATGFIRGAGGSIIPDLPVNGATIEGVLSNDSVSPAVKNWAVSLQGNNLPLGFFTSINIDGPGISNHTRLTSAASRQESSGGNTSWFWDDNNIPQMQAPESYQVTISWA